MRDSDQSFSIRPITSKDHFVIREVYLDAITSTGPSLYSNDQIKAWSSLAFAPEILDRSLVHGVGLVVVVNHSIEAFAIRYPSNHLDLLYSRGRSMRKGYGEILLKGIELAAVREGVQKLFTEASLFSYPLLLRCGWIQQTIDQITISGVNFNRYRMYKTL